MALTGSQLQVVGEVVVEVVPERLALLSRTILLSGMITGQQEGGALILRAQVGELIIRSPQPLPSDRVLMLQIPPGAPPVRAQVPVMGPVLPSPRSFALSLFSASSKSAAAICASSVTFSCCSGFKQISGASSSCNAPVTGTDNASA